jgi:hypothetical protein
MLPLPKGQRGEVCEPSTRNFLSQSGEQCIENQSHLAFNGRNNVSVTTLPIHIYCVIIASNCRIIKSKEELIENGVEGIGRDLNIITLRAFTLRGTENKKNLSQDSCSLH